jgi:hypothetical protein
VKPVLELLAIPRGDLKLTRDGHKLGAAGYAWDGRVLWLNATIVAPTEFELAFE